ncbi:hypothetical protein YC2023_069310 [Brassica napus]
MDRASNGQYLLHILLKLKQHETPQRSFIRASSGTPFCTMNITSEFNNVIITILENSDVQIHRRKKESLSMSSRVDVGPKTEVEMIVTLSAAGQKMIIRYEVDESQIPVNPYFVYLLMVPFLDFIVVIIIVKVGQRRKLTKKV